MSILAVEDLGIAFGGLVAVDGVTFAVQQSEIFAVIGPNGAGKTTLFNMVSGLYVPHRGRIMLDGEDVTKLPPHELARRGLSRTFQNLQIFFRMSVIENVMVGRHLHEKRNVLAHLFTLPSVHAQNLATRAKATELLALVGLADLADRPAADLNNAQQKMLDLVRALATRPRLLLLDELAAGLNPAELDWIAERIKMLARSGIAIIVIEHLMGFIEHVTDRVIVLNAGKEIFEGKLAVAVQVPQVIEVFLGGEHAA